MLDIARETAAALRMVGEPVILRRPGAGEVLCMGRVTTYAPQQIQGDVVQGDQHVIIANADILAASWPGPPRRGDTLVVVGQNARTTTVQSCVTKDVRGVVVRHELQIRG